MYLEFATVIIDKLLSVSVTGLGLKTSPVLLFSFAVLRYY